MFLILFISNLVLWRIIFLLLCGEIKVNPGSDSVEDSISSCETLSATFKPVKPSSNIFNLPFQGGASFVDLLFFSVLCLLCLCALLFICALLSPAGKGLTSWLSLVVSVSLSLSHWYPGSGVVLDCIDS